MTLLIDQEPNYLDPEAPYGEEKLYTLKLRNVNPLGRTGLPILFTYDPWITTFNMWVIDVEGEFVKFEVQDMDNEVQDMDNEVHPDPVFGHEAQVYVRKLDRTKDLISGSFIGYNLPITFKFTTGTFIAVPPGKSAGVGDREGGIIEETSGFKVKG